LLATVVLMASGAVTLVYGALAYHVVFDLHLGHVVQDGVDTGDVLAVPFLVAATASLVFGLYWASSVISAPLSLRGRPRSGPVVRPPSEPMSPVSAAGHGPAMQENAPRRRIA
jgi:hypothetical protein